MRKINEIKIRRMTEGGVILGKIMEETVKKARVGISTMELEMLVRDLTKKYKVEPSFTRVRNYQYYTCLSVNDVVVHGIPTDYKLQEGDILGVDIGVIHKGFNTDMSWSKIITGNANKFPQQEDIKTKKRFLDAGEKALLCAINCCKSGNRIGDISMAIQTNIEKQGYFVVKQLVGHAVGKNLHEYPQIPGILSTPVYKTEEIKTGMTLAIEVIYAMGSGDIVYKNNDGWSIATKDKSLSGLFEATVAVEDKETKILTPFDGLLNMHKTDIIESDLL